MSRARIMILSLCVLATAGCGGASVVSRNAGAMAFSTSGTAGDPDMVAQAQALDAMTRDLMRRATIKGAAVGAAAGCGLAVISASEGAKCFAGAVAGGAVGAVVGNAMGRVEVAKRVEIVRLSRVTPAISGAQKQMAHLNDGMADFIAAQDDEMAALTMQRDQGSLTQKQYEARLAQIRQNRAEVAEALTLSARQAHMTHAALVDARAKGQTGLDWHILQVETLEDEATSARARISLL